jgi:NADH:ubiquinone reductase (H+-translocating)
MSVVVPRQPPIVSSGRDGRLRIAHPLGAAGKQIVVVVGAGFAGLNVARGLANDSRVHVVLVDAHNHHLFQPLLYQVATAGLNPADIAVPIRSQFARVPNVEVHLARIEGVDLAEHTVYGADREIVFDYLVLALGARHSYFGRDDWEPFAPGLKTLEQATEIRRRMLTAFEYAENELDPALQERALTFVVVGGGPTGVELAGAIADISRTVLVDDFRRIDPSRARILLVEASPRILGAFPAELSARARRDLEAIGVEVRTDARVEEVDAEGVRVGAERIGAMCVFWAAGVQAAPLAFHPAIGTDRAGRVQVREDLSLPDHPEVFVAGDQAFVATAGGGSLPGVAQVAIQAGRHVAKTILGDLEGRPRAPFAYHDQGIMATIGKSRAIAQVGRIRLTGRLAWFAWLFVHVVSLIGFKNRLGVLWQWTWSYVFSQRGSRLITERDWRLRT